MGLVNRTWNKKRSGLCRESLFTKPKRVEIETRKKKNIKRKIK